MANSIPVPRSWAQIVSDETNAFLSRTGLPTIKVGSPVLNIIEATAQSQLRSSQDIFQMLQSVSIDNADFNALLRIGADENVPAITPTSSYGNVTVADTSFLKISTTVYQGTPAPIVGTTGLNVLNAASFPASGSVYIGRGTVNYEGPLAYTSITPPGGNPYYTINLSTSTQKFHDLGDTVILAQGGNRFINPGTVVQTPQGNTINAIQFKTLYPVVVPDGETQITNVQVAAILSGLSGNVGAGTISQFQSNPFSGATVTNPTPFNNGLSGDNTDSYRERIKNARQTRQLGTSLAVQQSVLNAVAVDENKKILSSSMVDGVNGNAATLYIDDGTGYEGIDSPQAYESLTDSAVGGELQFKLSFKPTTKAYVVSQNQAPFTLSDGMKLAFQVGGITTEHTFDADEFTAVSSASAYEAVASINKNNLLNWTARTTNNGTQVLVESKADVNDDIQNVAATVNDSAQIFNFSNTLSTTLHLFKNDVLLSKDGQEAIVKSQAFGQWGTLSGAQTLVLSVDGIRLNFDGTSFAAFTDIDFVNANTGFATLGGNSLQAWVNVFNFRIPGITASISNGLIYLTSNKGRDATAQVAILSGTLVTNHMFIAQTSTGDNADYIFERNTSEIQLAAPLVTGDKLTAGSFYTQAFIQSGAFSSTTLGTTGKTWWAIDGSAKIISTSINSSSQLTFVTDGVRQYGIKYKVGTLISGNIFGNVQVGDTAIFWDSNLPFSGTYRVASVAVDGSSFDIRKAQGTQGRQFFGAVKLNNGKFLLCGGYGAPKQASVTASSALYDPTTGIWTALPNMSTSRAGHGCTLLNDGRVLVSGGFTNANAIDGGGFVNTAEIFDPGTNTWTSTGNMGTTRGWHSQTTLNSGKVLSAGGKTSGSVYTNTAEIFDPGTGLWTNTTNNLSALKAKHSAVLFTTSGRVILAGGINGSGLTATSDTYDPGTNAFTGVAALGTARHSMAAIAQSGTVALFTGGSTAVSDTPYNGTDLYTDGSGWTVSTTMTANHVYHDICKLNNGHYFVFGGKSTTPYAVAEHLVGTTWSAVAMPESISLTTLTDRIGLKVLAQNPSSSNNAFVICGYDDGIQQPWSTIEKYDDTGNTWSVVDPFINASGIAIPDKGLTIVRNNGVLKEVDFAPATYTAQSAVTTLNSGLVGATASSYRTNSFRVSTNTFANTGNISPAAVNISAQTLGITQQSAVNSVLSHIASVESGNSETGTPDFLNSEVVGWASITQPIIQYSGLFFDSGNMLVTLRDFNDINANYQFESALSVVTAGNNGTFYTTTHNTPPELPITNERIYFASPYQLTANDTLDTVIDQDLNSQRYTTNMWRTIKPTTSTYGLTNAFTDADNSNASLAKAFGFTGNNPTDFTDFAVFMPARGITDSGDATKSILWRYKRLGPDGQWARVRYGYPSAASTPVSVTWDNTSSLTTDINITLPSGALRTGYSGPGPTYQVGYADLSSAGTNISNGVIVFGLPVQTIQRDGSGNTTLTCTLPPGVTDTGWVNGSGPFNFVSAIPGTYPSNPSFTLNLLPVLGAGTIQVRYNDGTAGASGPSANGGVMYFMPNQTASLVGGSTAQFDLVHFGTGTTIPSFLRGQTVRMTNDPSTSPYWITFIREFSVAPSFSTILGFSAFGTSAALGLQVFVNTGATANTIVAAVNAQSSSLVTAKALGSGAGTINTASIETLAVGGAGSFINLTDGVNYISSQSTPALISNNYSFTFKNAISSSLATADWTNETIKIIPKTAKNIVTWLGSLATSGLASAATIQQSSMGQKVQISSLTLGSEGSVQVQGNGANSATAAVVGTPFNISTSQSILKVETGDANSFVANGWFRADNTKPLPKNIITSGTFLQAIRNFGNTDVQYFLDPTSAPIFILIRHSISSILQIEAQGNFVAISDTGAGSVLDTSGVSEGDYVLLAAPALGGSGQISANNTGLFRVVRKAQNGIGIGGGTFWIENPNFTFQGSAKCDVRFIQSPCLVPGDILSINSNIWGTNAQGSWTVNTVGAQQISAVAGQMTRVASTVTVTCTGAHGFNALDFFTISPGEANFPAGTYQVVSAIPNSFTYTSAGAATSSTLFQVFTGLSYQSPFVFTASTPITALNTFSSALGANSPFVSVIEGALGRQFKQILSITPNQTDSTLTDIKVGYPAYMSEAAGTILTMLDKLNFPTNISTGIDGYRYSTGLIGQANKIVYGDASDIVDFPGVASEGSIINIQGPVVRRIQLSIAVRIKGDPSTIADRVKSAVAAVVNATPVGTDIAFSDVVDAAAKVTGVISVSIVSPTYNATNDVIPIQAFEKPLVLNLDTDLTVSFIGM